MEPLVVLLVIITLILTTLLVIVFVYVIMILKQLRHTVDHLNNTLTSSDRLLSAITGPFEHLGDAVTGVKTGLKFTEAFMSWLQQNHDSKKIKN